MNFWEFNPFRIKYVAVVSLPASYQIQSVQSVYRICFTSRPEENKTYTIKRDLTLSKGYKEITDRFFAFLACVSD